MKRVLWVTAIVLWSLTSAPVPSRADSLSPDERAFFDKHLSKVVQVEPTKLHAAALDRVFHATFYKVTVTINEGGGGSQSMDLTVARAGDDLEAVSKPSTTEDLPHLKEMLNPKFKLHTQQDAKAVQDALDVLYPISKGFGDKDLKAKAIKHSGNEWTFVRGEFFQKHAGFVFTTDASGAIQSVKYSLELP